MPESPAADPSPGRRSTRGRPAATSHAAIEQAAFQLFEERGFEATTLEDIAAEVGIGRRTLTRYYPSKNDIPWGQFDRTLEDFGALLASMPADLPLWECVHRGVVAFNDFPEGAQPPHRERMRLILETPALQAHSALRYAAWRNVIAEFVAARTGASSYDVLPRAVGHVSLGLALAAYETWLDEPTASLPALLEQSMRALRTYLA
jgi:TetR/AcrR family transcriptional regulator, regulator of mycofactocin system